MRITKLTFDPVQLLAMVGWVLLVAGAIPFTPVAVGIIGILSVCHLTFDLSR